MQHQTKVWTDPRRWPADLWRESMLILGREAGRDKYSIGDIQSRRKGSRLTACRRRLAWELHQNHGLSTPQIGALMRKDHSTVVRLLHESPCPPPAGAVA